VRESVLTLPHTPGNSRNSEGAFVTLKDGRILFAYTRYTAGTGQDDDSADLATLVSADAGQTWSAEPRLLMAREDARNLMSVSLLRLLDGRILMVYLRKDSDGHCRPFARISDDDAESWSTPAGMIPTLGYYVVNNDRVIQLSSGRILMPVAQHWHMTRADGNGRVFDMRGTFFVVYSDDAGLTWKVGPERWTLPSGRDYLQEPGCIGLQDGRIWTWLRTNTGRQWQMFSADEGESWTAPEPSRFQSPVSPLSMKRIPTTGDLLAVWNDISLADGLWGPAAQTVASSPKSWGRTPLAAAVSRDDGKTWSPSRILEQDPDHGFCYIAIHVEGDAVLLAYCCGGGDSGHVLQDMKIRRIPLEWFYRPA
jgi:sialidase-1